MKIISWNVNGIRAVCKKGFFDWWNTQNADVYCIQEVKAFPHQLDEHVQTPEGYYSYWHSGTRPGYAGVATFSKQSASQFYNQFQTEMFYEDGRVVETKFDAFTLLNIYFPNGQERADGTEMLSYKLKFYDEFLSYINQLRKNGESVIVCGDFNICHTEIDIARPKENENSIGFLPVERAWISKIIENGYIDTFRYFYPDTRDAYTWWSYRAGARPRNVGWRLDYIFVSPDLIDTVKNIEHQTDVMGSDHCPVCLEIDV